LLTGAIYYSVTVGGDLRRIAYVHREIVTLMSDTEYAEFQQALARIPEMGDVIPGLGGLRKVRRRALGRIIHYGAQSEAAGP